MADQAVIDRAQEVLKHLSPDSDWNDVIQALYERMVIEKGLAQADAGQLKSLADIRKKYGLSE